MLQKKKNEETLKEKSKNEELKIYLQKYNKK
jgi:hypothetical protein